MGVDRRCNWTLNLTSLKYDINRKIIFEDLLDGEIATLLYYHGNNERGVGAVLLKMFATEKSYPYSFLPHYQNS